MREFRILVVFFLAILSAACSLGSDEPEPTPCERLRDHMLDVSLADVGTEQRAQHRAALQQALGDFVETCSSQLSETQISCALATPVASAIRFCTNQ